MGNPFGEDSSIDSNANVGSGGGQDSGFAGLLNEIPQEFRDKISPHLQEYQNLQKAHEPWKNFSGRGVTPDTVQIGLNFMDLLESNPRQLWDMLGQTFNFTKEEIKEIQNQQQQDGEVDPYKERFDGLEKANNTLARTVLEMRQAEVDAKADSALEREFDTARKAVGDFDVEWVTAKCIANKGLSVQQAAQMYKEWEAGRLKEFAAKPRVMGSGGGLPSGEVDVTKLNPKDTRSYVAQLIQHANAERRG